MKQHTCQSIIPPFMIEAIAERGEGPVADNVHEHLEHDRELRQGRPADERPPPPPGSDTAPQPGLHRSIYDGHNAAKLPGTLVLSEGHEPPADDAAVAEAYAGLGATFTLFDDTYGHQSFNDRGAALHGTVHHRRDYANAFWNGRQMVFGDGDGEYFHRFTAAVDVIAHELTHAVTERTARLEYQGQPGALNESVSDVFGSLVKQFSSPRQQAASDADWLIGAELLTDKVQGQALRSMKAPGTAYNDPVLGRDPQPGHMDDYVDTTEDNGGVHINSGIPNHAFFLVATGLGGYAWERAGRIWFATLTDEALTPTADFVTFAGLTVKHAEALFDQSVQTTVANSWRRVGIEV